MTGFGLDHLPFGVYSLAGGPRRIGVRVGDRVLDVAAVGLPELTAATLNPFMALGPAVWREARSAIRDLAARGGATVPVADIRLHLAFEVADYVDFYASQHHASNVGRIFRPESDPLPPNWRHLPVGYHGRAGTVVVSGTPVSRPSGLRTPGDAGPTRRLDLEAEVGFVLGVPSPNGTPVPGEAFDEHVFGVVGLNDWSARDIQAFETRPLGPFLGKSFATSVSAWVTPLAALDAAWCDLPPQDPPPVGHLAVDGARGLDIDVEVEIDGEVISRPPFSTMYWAPAQMLAHLTANGAGLRTGDLFASGTISGPRDDQVGSLLELHRNGRFLDDGQQVVLRYSAPSVDGGRLALGEVAGRVISPRPA